MIIGLLISFNSCKNETDLQKQESPKDFKTEAKTFFEENLAALENKKNFGEEKLDEFQKLSKKALWDFAKIQSITIGESVKIPISFSKNFYIKAGKDKRAISYQNLSYLMMYKDKSGKMHTEWVTTIPDDAYVDSKKNAGVKFSGVIIVRDWKGNIIKGYQVNQTGNVEYLNSYSCYVDNNDDKKIKTLSSTGPQCLMIQSWDCHGISGGVECSRIYQWTCFSTESLPGGGGSTGGGGGGVGGGGNGSPALPIDYEPPVNNDIIKTDCLSFYFKKTTSANWQEAGVNSIRLKWVWVGGNYSGISRELFINQVVFGLPTQYQNPDNSITFLSSGEAAVKAAIITEQAKYLTYTEFRDHPLLPDDAIVIQYFRDQLQILMASIRGTAGFTGSGSPNIVFKNEERSNFFDPYSCN